MAQDGPKTAREVPKTAPRQSKTVPRRPRSAPRRAPGPSSMPLGGVLTRLWGVRGQSRAPLGPSRRLDAAFQRLLGRILDDVPGQASGNIVLPFPKTASGTLRELLKRSQTPPRQPKTDPRRALGCLGCFLGPSPLVFGWAGLLKAAPEAPTGANGLPREAPRRPNM